MLRETRILSSSEEDELSGKIRDLDRRLRALQRSKNEEEASALSAELRQLQERRKRAVTSHIASCRVVATTIASALGGQSPIPEHGPWSTVIVDEASMVNGAAILALSAIAARRLLLAGDPRQLNPICEWSHSPRPDEVTRWIASDPYQLAGLVDGAGNLSIDDRDRRLVRVMAQRRCHPSIWSLVEHQYPRVQTDVDLVRLAEIAMAPPAPEKNVVFMDLSGDVSLETPSEATDLEIIGASYGGASQAGKSWQNPSTAMLAIDMAREFKGWHPEASVAIVTPYRGQVRLIRRWIEEERKADPKTPPVEVGTVHSFQGGEADFVILDLVDGPPRPDLGFLLSHDTGSRLINVAITRARAKLAVIGHLEWLRTHTLGKADLLRNILFGEMVQQSVCEVSRGRDLTESAEGAAQPESHIEVKLLEEFRRRPGMPAVTLQHRILDESGRIISRADFAFVEHRLAVFCDGAKYHLEKNQWQRDLRQRRGLVRLGWQVIAFTGREIEPPRNA